MAKRIGILVVVFLVAMVFWTSAKAWIDSPTGSFEDYYRWVIPLGLMMLYAGVSGLAFLLLERKWAWGALGLSILAAVFAFGFHELYLIGLGGLLLLGLMAVRRVRNEYASRREIYISGIIGPAVGILLTSIFLFLSVAYYTTPQVREETQGGKLPQSISRMIQDIARKVLSEELEKLPPNQRSQAERQIVSEVTSYITSLLGPYTKFIPILLAVGLFLLLESVRFVFSWLAIAVAAGIFMILKATGFVTISERDIKAQQIVL